MKNREVQRRSLTITIMFLVYNSLLASPGKSWGENIIITSATENYQFYYSKSRNIVEIKQEKAYNYSCLNYRLMPQLPKDIELHHPNFHFTISCKVTGNTI